MNRGGNWRGSIWRGELATALALEDENAARIIARNLGLVEVEIDSGPQKIATEVLSSTALAFASEGFPCAYPIDLDDAYFWQPVRYEARADIKLPTPPPGETKLRWTSPPASPPPQIPIASKRFVHPRLRTGVSSLSPGRGLDLERIVRTLARGDTLRQFPKKRLRRWGRQILIVLDRSDRLVPFFQDQVLLCEQLEELMPEKAIKQLFTTGPDQDFVHLDFSGDLVNYAFDTPSRVVLLSDLGVLQAGANERLRERWYQWGRKMVNQGFQLVALVPFPAQVAGSDLRRVFSLVPWQQSAADYVPDPIRRSQLVDEILAAVSPAVRLEPGLLRAIRMVIPEAVDASLEAGVWQHPAVTSPHPDAAALDRRVVEKRYFPAFAKLPSAQRARILSELRAWRFTFSNSPEIWFEEILNLDSDSQRIVAELFPGDPEDAVSGLQHLAKQAKHAGTSHYLRMLREYGGRATDRLSERAWRDPRIRQAVHDLWDASPRKLSREIRGLDPALLGEDGELACVTLTQCGGDFQFTVRERDGTSFAAELWTRNRWIGVASSGNDKSSFWKSGRPPSWASDWGRDEYGMWCEFELHKSGFSEEFSDEFEQTRIITQRLRWIRPGKFLMGSAESEVGRWADEGQQHEVTLTCGYWMFDTPVTQQLWQAVMGENPSRFKGDRRPVENVSWEEAQQFLTKLNERLGEPPFVLPTEAQWEYACRAGTTTRYAFGDELSPAQARFSVSAEQGTSAVGSHDPNRWGLFDMHGNVLEWCQDYWADDYSGAAATDPTGPSRGLIRVLRGGCWYDYAQVVRSAFRDHSDPGSRYAFFGFRCAQVQGAAEPAEEDGRAAEPLAYPTNDGAAAALKIDSDVAQQTPIPSGPVIIVRSDVDSLELRKIPKPDWASAIGRDRYGLWAEFTFVSGASVEKEDRANQDVSALSWDELRSQAKKLGVPAKGNRKKLEAKVRQARSRVGQAPTSPEAAALSVVQRMRWIPPGRFLMGSPEGDEMAYKWEKPQHEVTLSHGYWLFDTPVTQQLWLAVMNDNPSHFPGPIRPVEQVSWEDCQTFLQQINGAIRDLNLTLPTEAEWEYACRAGTMTRYAFGDRISRDQANYYESEQKKHETSDVKSFAPNARGLFDMHGNVWEWCQDYWAGDYKNAAAIDPTGPSQGHDRVLRGGSWDLNARLVRSAFRIRSDPGDRLDFIGFRCAQVQSSSREASE
ncbi:MAG: formylglycine-generating enzyme family protein [Planctomycetota bacterium]|nr:formylglycine-generating enzyme family protein [Planctomycetota bacterium]